MVLPAVAEMLGLLYKLRRGLLWSWWQRPITKVSIYFVINSVRELLDTSS
jgi:hypothetical protein